MSFVIGHCDCCDKERTLTQCWAFGIETWACWECRGLDEEPEFYEENDEERYRTEMGEL